MVGWGWLVNCARESEVREIGGEKKIPKKFFVCFVEAGGERAVVGISELQRKKIYPKT